MSEVEMRRFLVALGLSFATGMTSCDSNSSSVAVDPRPEGVVSLTFVAGPIGVLARKMSMVPARMVLEFTTDGLPAVRDTQILSNGGAMFVRSYPLAGNRTWKLEAKGFDQRDSLLYHGGSEVSVPAGRQVDVNLELQARYSSARLHIPIRDSFSRVQVSVDGAPWVDSSLPQLRSMDSLVLERDYLAASAAGTAHSLAIRIHGKAWGMDTLVYALDTVLRIQSGASGRFDLPVSWVGPRSMPVGYANLVVALGSVGALVVRANYGDSSAEAASFLDPRNGALYPTKRFGEQLWMLRNLGAACSGCDSSGTKFTSEQVLDACPVGWHVPDTMEWRQLVRWAARGASDSFGATSLRSVSGWRAWLDAYPASSSWSIVFNGDDAFGFGLVPTAEYQEFIGFVYDNFFPLHAGGTTAEMWTSSITAEGERIAAIFDSKGFLLGTRYLRPDKWDMNVTEGKVRCVAN